MCVGSTSSNLTEALGKFAVPAFGNPDHRWGSFQSWRTSSLSLSEVFPRTVRASAGCPLSQDHRSGRPDHLISLSSVIFHLPPDFWPALFLTHSYRFAYSKKTKDKKVILLSPTSDLCLLCSLITNRLQLSQAASQMAGVCFPLPSMAQPAQCSAFAYLS